MHINAYDQLEKGSLFHGRYRVQKRLGAGAMGAVYEVVDETTQSLRALKVMQPALVREAVHRERFAQEAKITGKIESDHLVRVLDAGVDPASGMPFLTMDLLRGETLCQELEVRCVLPLEDVKRYLQQISFALTKTHAAGIVHRDLKPDNLFITRRDDGSPCLKILDFGIAKVVAGTQQATATRIGTPLYMAPEQLTGRGPIGPPIDIHALGHLAYEMLVGEAYWAEESLTAGGLVPFYQALLAGPLEAASSRAHRRRSVALPRHFDAWFTRAVARQPEARFSSVVELVRAFERLCSAQEEWAERTIAAGPLMQVFNRPPPLDTDSGDIVQVFERSPTLGPDSGDAQTVVKKLMPPLPPTVAMVERDLDPKAPMVRFDKRIHRQMQWAILGVIAIGCILVLLILLHSRSARTNENVDEIISVPSSRPLVAEIPSTPPHVPEVLAVAEASSANALPLPGPSVGSEPPARPSASAAPSLHALPKVRLVSPPPKSTQSSSPRSKTAGTKEGVKGRMLK